MCMCEWIARSTSRTVPSASFTSTALLGAVDHGLLALGEIVRSTIYDRMEESYQVKREEIPEKLDTFHKALQEMLGRGAEVVRRLIAKNLYSSLNLKFAEHENWTLVDYVQDAEDQTTSHEPRRISGCSSGKAGASRTSADLSSGIEQQSDEKRVSSFWALQVRA